MRKTHFNFRDAMRAAGVPITNKRDNWAVGQMLRAAAGKHRIPVSYPLTQKTDPDATVGARHCIAAYPMAFWGEAVDLVRGWAGERVNQPSLL